MWAAIFASIAGTLIVGAIIYFARFLIIVPIGQKVIEKILAHLPKSRRNISGTWQTEFWKGKDGETFEEVATVSELWGRVWGTIEYRKGGQKRKYRISGTVVEGVFVATYEIESPKEPLDRGSFTLTRSLDGMALEGCYSWTDDESDIPQGNKYVWRQCTYSGLNGIQVKKSAIHGQGIIANKEFPPDSEIAYFHGYEVDRDTYHSLTLDGRKIEPTGPLKYLNHSCNPNCLFQGRTLVTSRQVKRGEELTIDYWKTEVTMKHTFDCNCRYSECRRRICSPIS